LGDHQKCTCGVWRLMFPGILRRPCDQGSFSDTNVCDYLCFTTQFQQELTQSTGKKCPSMSQIQAQVLASTEPTLTPDDLQLDAPKSGEVLVDVAACGVCHTDLHVMKEEVNFPRPAVLGHEISGVVVDVGDDVDHVAAGDRIVAAFIMP